MSLDSYVKQNFGQAYATQLRNIRRGGDNNNKGASFETYFAAAKICEIAATQTNLHDFLISSQELAFVDDLCLRQDSIKYKENFQAKNSSGAAAVWNESLEEKFRMQINIDKNYHNAQESYQTLLVSCPKIAESNNEKIPADLQGLCRSKFFPYNTTATKLLYDCPQLKEWLTEICNTGDPEDLSILDVAFRCVVSAWICGSTDTARSVGDLIGQAKADSRPNVFRDGIQESPSIPGWLHHLCSNFQDLEGYIEFGNVKIRYNGMEASLGRCLDEPDETILAKFRDVWDVMEYLMSQIHQEL